MRTRILNKMLASEVEEYLARGGNTIFVGVGVVEVHGGMPADVEQIVPEAMALAMAEEYDGLALINLPYNFPGGTIVSNATVQMSVRDSIDYLMKICHSRVAQGFKKIFMLSAHGPARLYIDAMVRDFFQETKVMVCNINTMRPMMTYKDENGESYGLGILHMMAYGGYKMLHQEAYLPVDPNGKPIPEELTVQDPRLVRMMDAARACGVGACILFGKPEEHGGTDAPFKSIEDRDAACAKGEKIIRDIVKSIPISDLQAALDDYEGYIKDMQEKYPRLKGIY